jgi:hypothetical protein
VGHVGVPAVRAEGVHDDQDEAWQGGQVAGNVRDNVQTAGDDVPGQAAHTVREGAGVDDAIVQAKEADDAHDDTNDAIVVGPEVPKDGGGGEADDTIVQAKEANADHDDANDTAVVGPEVPIDEEGGEDDPVQGMFETGGRKSKMTKQELFDPGGGGGGIAKSHGNRASISVANYSFVCPREPSHVHLLSSSRSDHNLV